MHPDLLHALAQERRADLLRHNQFRHRRRLDTQFPARVRSRPIPRLRHSLGVALVRAGTRLLGGTAAPMEIAGNRD
jgi:hypothetical protein